MSVEKELFFDISDLVYESRKTNHVTGIQRVVFNTAWNLQKTGRKVSFFWRNDTDRLFYILDGIDFNHINDLSTFRSIAMSPLSGKPKWSRTRKELLTSKKFRARLKLIIQFLKAYFNKQDQALVDTPVIINGITIRRFDTSKASGATLLFFSIISDFDAYEALISSINSVKVIFFYHDVIPLSIPETCGNGESALFKKYIPFIYEKGDVLLTSSQFNIKDLSKYVDLNNTNTVVKAIGLPTEVKAGYSNLDIVDMRPEVRWLKQYKFCLCVGSIGPRKNHYELLLAWQRYFSSDSYSGEVLVIAGGIVGEMEWMRDFIARESISRAVLYVPHASDKELAFLYDNCSFTVYPSLYEGWGLPVSESIYFRKPVIHYEISSMPEAGFGLGNPIKRRNIKDLEGEICKLFTDTVYYETCVKKIEKGMGARYTWSDFTDKVLSSIDEL